MNVGSKKNIGNFILSKKNIGKVTCMVVNTASGNWSMVYRPNNTMFKLLDNVKEEEEDALRTFFTTVYALAHVVDGELTDDAIKAIDAYFARVNAGTNEEDAKILEEERMAHEMREELERLEGDVQDKTEDKQVY